VGSACCGTFAATGGAASVCALVSLNPFWLPPLLLPPLLLLLLLLLQLCDMRLLLLHGRVGDGDGAIGCDCTRVCGFTDRYSGWRLGTRLVRGL